MNSQEVLRIIDSICRDKAIDKEMVYADLEAAMVSAARKAYGQVEDITVKIDRMTGQISALMEGRPIAMADLGRIAAQTCKQVMIQRIREAERGSIFDEYSDKVGTVVTGQPPLVVRGSPVWCQAVAAVVRCGPVARWSVVPAPMGA